MTIDPRLHRIVASQPYPLLFATISGAHLYGFPSPDSDYDLRGAHKLPLSTVIGLETGDETVEEEQTIEGLEMDIVSHDIKKFFGLLLKKNGLLIGLSSPKNQPMKRSIFAQLLVAVSLGASTLSSPLSAAEILWSQYCQHVGTMKLLVHLDSDPTAPNHGEPETVSLWLRNNPNTPWTLSDSQPIDRLTATTLFKIDSWSRHS